MKEITSYLEKHQKEILADIQTLVKAESPTEDIEAVNNCGEILIKLFSTHLNVQPEIIKENETANHLRFRVGQTSEQILILGHFDTVWEHGALPLLIKGNKFFGPGAIDMKGGLVQAIWAVKALIETGVSLEKSIVFLCNGDHEGIASPTSRPYIESEALKSEAVLVPEAPQGKTGALKTSRKGVLRYTITFQGIAAHSGNNHEAGVSANHELAKQLIYLESLTDYHSGTTVNVGQIHGGTSVNVVPESAELKVDIRVTNSKEAERIDRLVGELKSFSPKVSLKINGGIMRPVMERTEKTVKLFNIAKEAAEEIGIPLTEAAVGGGSDGSFASSLGVPTLDGLGAAGDGPHAEHEHILIDQLPYRSSLISHVIKQLAE